MTAATYVFLASVTALTFVAAWWDLRTRKLPNWLTVSGFAAAIVFHLATGGLSGLGYSLLGFLTGFTALLVLWLTGGGGAGDVKLMGALGAWLGAKATICVFIVSAVLIVIGFLGWFLVRLSRYFFGSRRAGPRKGFLEMLRPRRTAPDSQRMPTRRGVVPFALPLALSTWLVLLATQVWGDRLGLRPDLQPDAQPTGAASAWSTDGDTTTEERSVDSSNL